MPDGAYERTDAVVGNVRRWATVLVLFVGFGSSLAMGFFYVLAPSPFHAAAEIPSQRISSGPLPQDNATTRLDIANLRAREQEILDRAGPSVVHPGARRIPIAEAMARLAATGLPPRPGAPAPLPDALPSEVLDQGAH